MFTKRLKKYGKAKILILVMIFLSVALVFGTTANAAIGQNSEGLKSEQTINGPGFFAGNLVQVDGTVEGTTFAAGQEIRINGIINGDLFVAGQTIYVNGKINGNIYAAGQNLSIGTQSSGDVFLAGQNVDINKEAVIGRDLFAAGARVSLAGTVQRLFSGGGSDILINGSVGRDANLDAENIKLLDGAVIKGNLSYKSANQAVIDSGSTVSGQTNWQYVTTQHTSKRNTYLDDLGSALLSIASAILIWFLVRIWRPDLWTNNARFIAEQPLKTLGTGILTLLVTPLLIILMMVTVIGIPIGIILGLIYVVTIYLSKIIVAVFIGSWLTKRFNWTEQLKGFWPILLGLVILVILMKVPILGFLVWLLAVFAGLGSFILSSVKSSTVAE
ncbi:MAG: polymer-forming cytoskeletal protein [Desulfitobacteriaceae bacterium]|nr:polymer-forming cytoskeletal protein [Desulfitobacteriaceae bacterium]MDD4346921.1 polymer-forming cytoskeletal protein [Desulfitobacteriaceae bacterium]MDD4401949.1 polymer-forming cytoskeletal protein [Desulfitobacteriaceae bacterium]